MAEYEIVVNGDISDPVETNISLRQGDYGIVFYITVENMNTVGAVAHIVFRKSDGNFIETVVNSSNNKYRYTLTGMETQSPGKVVADIKFYREGQRISTASFLFNIVVDTLNTAVISGSYSDSMEEMIKAVKQKVEILINSMQIEINNMKGEINKAQTYVNNLNALINGINSKLENGDFKGEKGEQGARGIRGSQWFQGNGISGETITPQIFPASGVSEAYMGDCYLNNQNGNAYWCTTGGTPQVAKWLYITNLRGVQGIQGISGLNGKDGKKGEKGEKGEKGDKGDNGKDGKDGEKGERGLAGIQGIQGEKGEKGDKGDSGLTITGNGFFTLAGDENGDLWAYYSGDIKPEFETNNDGDIYYIF